METWFQDEARVGQKGTLSYVWAPRGSRPAAVRDNRHDCAYLFGAICPDRATGAAIIMPAVNSEAMGEHLAEISRQVTPNAHAVVVCDGAGWHQNGERLSVPDNISLLRLPLYAPELNPIENVWEYLRGNKLSMIVWNSYDAIVEACRDAWNWLMTDPIRIRSITTRPWASVWNYGGWYYSTHTFLMSAMSSNRGLGSLRASTCWHNAVRSQMPH